MARLLSIMGQIQKMTFWCATVGGVALPESGGQLIPQLFRIYQPPKKRMSTGLGQIRYSTPITTEARRCVTVERWAPYSSEAESIHMWFKLLALLQTFGDVAEPL